jgi:site-specific recombinase XerD
MKSGKDVARFTPSTVNIMLGAIHRFFNWSYEQDIIDKLPFKIKLLKIDKSHPKFLTDEEVSKLLEHADEKPHVRDIFLIHMNTGMRLGELKNSTLLSDRKHLKIINTKGHQDRIIPIDPDLVGVYEQVKERDLSEYYITHEFKRIVRKAGLSEEFTFHSLRHTFAVRHWFRHCDIYLTKQILGHSSVTVTEMYIRIPMSYLKNVINIRNNKS